MKQMLHPGARWLFRVQGYFLFGILLLFFGFWIAVPASVALSAAFSLTGAGIAGLVVLGILLYIAVVLIVSEVYARMSYNRWFYEFADSGIRLERGIIWKRYSNVPYERVQNVDVHRGIIARIFGFSSIMAQTAGYSAQPYSEGYIPAVDMHEAEHIREMLLKKIVHYRRA